MLQLAGTYYTRWFNADVTGATGAAGQQLTGDFVTITEHRRVYVSNECCT